MTLEPIVGPILWNEDDVAQMKALQALGESVEVGAGGHCGPVGVCTLSRIILRSHKADEFAALLPWVLTRKLGNKPVD